MILCYRFFCIFSLFFRKTAVHYIPLAKTQQTGFMEEYIMLKLLAATKNKHKVAEFQAMLEKHGLKNIEIISTEAFPEFPELTENGSTFEENSAMKAEQASRFADMPAFADDSGLSVQALNGAPGVYSARYAGENATDADRIAKLLKEMQGVKDRSAAFVCVITLAYRGKVFVSFCGEVKGKIAEMPGGNGGFGYDPIFIPDGYDKTFAELGNSVKDRISHRAGAFEQAVDFIRTELKKMGEPEFV